MRNFYSTIKVLSLSMMLSLTGCAGLSEIPFSKLSSLSPASFSNIDDPIAEGTPVLLYSHIARNIKQCWLKPPNQILTKHAFYARATPDQSGGKATITLNEQTKTGKKGLTAFKIDFVPVDGGKTNIRIDNFRLDPKLATRLTTNVRFWSKGNISCDNSPNNNAITSVPEGVKISPIKVKN